MLLGSGGDSAAPNKSVESGFLEELSNKSVESGFLKLLSTIPLYGRIDWLDAAKARAEIQQLPTNSWNLVF
jgi:hypothetical protein